MTTSIVNQQGKKKKRTEGGFSRREILLTATLVAGAAVLATSAEAGCYVYEHSEFVDGGRLRAAWTEFLDSDVGVAINGEAVEDLGEGWNDIVSSVRVTRHCLLTLYEHEGFTGDLRQFGPGSYDLGGTSWNDRATGAHCTCR